MRDTDRCNELCTKTSTGFCALCDALAERDRFEQPFRWLAQLPSRGVRILVSWCQDARQYVTGPTGYRAVVPVLVALVGTYVGLYTIAVARHDRLINRAIYERSTFMSIVTSDNREAYHFALKSFGAIQTLRTTREPTLWPLFGVVIEEQGQERTQWPLWPWQWITKKDYLPNREPLWRWAQVSLELPRYGDLGGADLRGADLHDIKLGFTGLSHTNLAGTNLYGTDLSRAVYLTQAQLDEACMNERTKLPPGLTRPPKQPEACKQWQHP